MTALIDAINNLIWSKALIALCLGAGLYFSIRTRFMQVQRNVPGALQRLNDAFARRGINIAAQYYQTDGEIGYVVVEADEPGPVADDILAEIRSFDGTVRARIIYERG